MKKYVFESLKFFCAAILCTILSAFTTPAFANCNLTQRIINKTYTGVGSSVVDEHALISGITYKENTPYTITIDVEPSNITFSEDGNLLWWSIKYTDGSSNYTGVTTSNYNNGRVSVTTDANKTVESISGLSNHERWTGGTLKVSNLQIEEGSTATPYQPYNPLCATCKNGVSPNLFETVDTTSSLYGVTLTSAANGLVTVVGTATGGGGRNTARLQNFTLPAGTYTVSFSGTKRSQLYLVAGNDSNATNLITDVNGGTFTISESKTLHFGLNLNNGTTYNDSFYIQLEAGSTATPYQPYGCIAPITIATTKYNESAFGPLNTALANAISVVDTVVSNTITQAGRIATLQAQKQTRPNDIADDNEKCPAGKKCLLVEDASGVPHWYEIVESVLQSDYTELEYLRSDGRAYINTNYSPTSKTRIEIVAKLDSGAGNVNIVGSGHGTTGDAGNALLVINSLDDNIAEVKFAPTGAWIRSENVNMLEKNRLSLSATKFSVNGDVKETNNTTIPDTDNQPFYIFQRWRPSIASTNSKTQVYEFSIYENDILVRNMIPVKRNSDGVLGMFDTVNDMFYTNAGTGEFIAGDPVTE